MNRNPTAKRSGLDDRCVLSALEEVSRNPDSVQAFHALRASVRSTRVLVNRQFSQVPGFRMEDVENDAFREALEKYDPERGSFTGWYRRVFTMRVLDAIKSAEGQRWSDADVEGSDLESAEAVAEQMEAFAKMKDFLVVAMSYAGRSELRALQGLVLGEDMGETANRHQVGRQHIWRGSRKIFALAELYAKGEVPFPVTPESRISVRKAIAQSIRQKEADKRSKKSHE